MSKAYYISHLIVPLSGDPSIPIKTATGLTVAMGFQRVVIGARGAYVEFTDSQIVMSSIARVKVPHYYYDEWRTTDAACVKFYHQMATVGYADYLVGMWYVTPLALFLADGRCLIKPPACMRADPPEKTIFD